MHPAFSIIVFTTLSGLGYGLAAVLGLGILDPAAMATKLAHLAALVLIGVGLLSSTLHLGNPQRAWRALSQWRSSWLSREGVMALLTFLPLLWSAWFAVVEGRHAPVAGLLGAAGAAVTIYCTGMIYASLKSVQTWHTPLTPLCFILFALSGGLTLASLAGAAGGGDALWPALGAIAATIAAWIAKTAWRRRMLSLRPLSTPETATGLGSIGKVRLFERPHMNENYLTREMGFVIARKHAAKLARISFLAGGALPVLLLLVAAALSAVPVTAAVVIACAALLHYAGMFVERWLFFAEARHAVMNYYEG
ncbi:DmsC/YnfH family molybdoenzyme membrane anchor subunit [Mesorhizobium sp. LHD-90]|uniref:dimethyl sulfoxide reductase anchor subunit family protein n=1 Tax=Mesorhizobium sp. LHD-90 TaxID=3071414 RepID=UPI0027DF64A3|nr:DmsC/YnfH family molybdoenzyme membrane anchor subunit [Mesorhizobium sp. LHD-90]MDQ6433142.1 DmsC/YnfH family molybdoenzyme membrane anchor subunit [Mesorhizobium sp. LHD-90]